MADQQSEQDKTEPATPSKLREAQRRGQVAKSMEINSLFIISGVLCVLYLIGDSLIQKQLQLSHALLSNTHLVSLQPNQLIQLFDAMVDALIGIFWPMVATIMLIALLVNMFQTGPIFSFYPLKPDVQRINPVAGFKRLFSAKLLFESLKTIIKIGLFAGVIYFAMAGFMPSLMGLLDRHPDTYPAYLLESSTLLALKMVIVLFVVAMLDLLYARWDYSKKMRMSRRELKEEIKRREGDPQIRAKIRELQKEAAKRASSLQNVPDADVLITNPTHLAVALSYQRGEMIAPVVIAKGSGELALRMREVARQHHVVVVENKKLARSLFKAIAIDQPITEKLYPAVAKILVWVFTMRDQSNYSRHSTMKAG